MFCVATKNCLMIAKVLQEFLKTGTPYLLLPFSGFIISLVLSLLRRTTKKQKIQPKRKAQANGSCKSAGEPDTNGTVRS